MKLSTAKNLIKKTKENYCQISESFSKTRQWIWPELLVYLNKVKKGDCVLDFGCGNGRLVEFLKDKEIVYIGLDSCKNFIENNQRKYKNQRFVVGDVLNAPLENNLYDKIFSIAVFDIFLFWCVVVLIVTPSKHF